MIILIDNREQNKLEFDHPYITEIEHTTLKVGDYGCRYIDGYIPPVFFERKSIPDLFNTLTNGHERFKREIERAKELDYKLILVIEGTFSKVMNGYERSQVSGLTIIKQLFMLWIKYGLEFHLLKDRVEMSHFIQEYFLAIGRLKGKKDKKNVENIETKKESV
jgi:ERCC4-type nuclease